MKELMHIVVLLHYQNWKRTTDVPFRTVSIRVEIYSTSIWVTMHDSSNPQSEMAVGQLEVSSNSSMRPEPQESQYKTLEELISALQNIQRKYDLEFVLYTQQVKVRGIKNIILFYIYRLELSFTRTDFDYASIKVH